MSAGRGPTAGFGLVEALVATALFMTIAAAVAPLLLLAGTAILHARDQTMTAALAAAKLEELEGLAFGYRVTDDGSLEPLEDTETNLAVVPPGTSGGPGLASSPGDALLVCTQGYVDFLDARGRWLGTGTTAPPGSRYTRRWSVARWSADPDSLLLRVVAATTTGDFSGGPRLDTSPRRGDTWLFSMKTRVRP